MEQLLTLPEHELLITLESTGTPPRNGISDIEVRHLSWLGANMQYKGDIVEIGSYMGKSICCMAAGARLAKNPARIFAVDPWDSIDTTAKRYRSLDAWEGFQRQVAMLDLTERIRPVKATSIMAVSRRGKPVHLLFIDGSHKYLSVLEDYTEWSKFMPPGAFIAFHDYSKNFPGVKRVVEETVIPSGLWKDYHVYDRIWSATRA